VIVALYVAAVLWTLGALLACVVTVFSLRDVETRRRDVERSPNGRRNLRLMVLESDRKDELAALSLQAFLLLVGVFWLVTPHDAENGIGWGRLIATVLFLAVEYVQVQRTVSKRRERRDLREAAQHYVTVQRPSNPQERRTSP
jgi:hypothetical protein